MKKLASSFASMVLVLGGVSILAAAALASVHALTEVPIRQAAQLAQENAIRAVVPAFDNSPVEDRYWLLTTRGDSLPCFPAYKGGELIGVAIESYSRRGYGGLIKVMVGLEPDGSIHGFSVLSHSETPGLGSKMETWYKTPKSGQFLPGVHPAVTTLRVRKDGGDVDAITAATITSRAFLEAINTAFQAYSRQQASAPTNPPVSCPEAPSSDMGLHTPPATIGTSAAANNPSAKSSSPSTPNKEDEAWDGTTGATSTTDTYEGASGAHTETNDSEPGTTDADGLSGASPPY